MSETNNKIFIYRLIAILAALSGAPARGEAPGLHTQAIFPHEPKHNHASCVIETAPGNFLTAWYSGSGERKSDDVVIEGAWLCQREKRSCGTKFLLA